MSRPCRSAGRLLAPRIALALLVSAVAAGGCSGDDAHPPPPWATTTLARPTRTATVIVADAKMPAALTALPDGGLIYGERATGRLVRLAPDLALPGRTVATVELSAVGDSQRGLLGVTVDAGDGSRVFASWTRAGDGRIVVAQVAPGATRLVWEGPTSADVANAARLVWRDDRIVMGVGDLNRGQPPEGSTPGDATDWRGTILSLDPNGPADQLPTVLSSGWNNPYAITVGPDGDLWLADNIGGGCCERLGHVPSSGDPIITELGDDQHQIVPAAIVPLGPGEFGVCSYFTHQMLGLTAVDGRLSPPGAPVFDGCSIAAVRLEDGRVVLATETDLSVGVV